MTHFRTRLAAAALCAGALSVQAAPLDDIRRQVEASQFEAAWKTAQDNPQLVGDVHFDFLYGLAAINVGRVPEGLLALERHLAAVPANDRARLELARGYFLLGEYGRARAEFEFVLRYNPPAGVRTRIGEFLQAMQVREVSAGATSSRLYVEVGLGHDNNVNGGTVNDELQLGFGSVSLIGSPSKPVADGYGHVGIGGQRTMRVSNRFSVFAGADLEQRAHFQERDFDLGTFGGYIGFTQLGSSALWRVTLNANQLQVGHKRYRDSLTAGAEATLTFSPELSLQAFAQAGEMRHAQPEEARDARVVVVGAIVTRNFDGVAGSPQLALRASWTQEDSTALRDDLSRKIPLARASISVLPMQQLRVSAGLSAWRQNHGGTDVVFGTVRKDQWVGADLVATYAIDAAWTLRADAQWQHSKSNQDLYDSSRKTASLKLRYQF